MMIGWWEHSQKGVTDGRTDRRTDRRTDGRTDWTIHRAAWSQLKIDSTRGRLGPSTFGFMPNALTIWAIRARHLLSRVFEHWIWRYRYFWSKVNICNVNCERATTLIYDTRTDVLVKVSKFLRQKMSRPEGTRTPNLRIHAESFNHLSYQGQTFAVPFFSYTSALRYDTCFSTGSSLGFSSFIGRSSGISMTPP